jgi:HEAT repeat protein
VSASEDPGKRRRTAALAGHQGDEATARALLADPDPGVRSTAYGSLQRLGAFTDADLRRAAADPDPGVRRRASELAAASPADHEPGELDNVLLELLADPDGTVVESAAWACGERPGHGNAFVAQLAEVARRHTDALCREAAVAALGALGDERGLPAILDALGDKATVRRRAVIALAPFDGPEVEAALARHLTDRDRQVRQAAEDLLGR